MVVLAVGISAAGAQKPILPGEASKSAGMSPGERKKIQGTITGRDGEKVTIRLATSEADLAVKLNALTQVREKKNNPFRRARKYGINQLTPGLTVEVEGRGDSDGALVADKILFTNDDLKMAQSVNARIAPVEENERRMSGQIEELDAVSNAAKGGAKAAQATADAAHSRIAALDDYETVRNVIVHFKVGSAVLSDDARKSLDDLARQTESLKGFVIEVAGFASSEGGLAFNQRLSRRRAEAVSEYLAEQHNIPLRRIMTPTGYGVSHPVSDNSTRAGRQENRRVEVRLLVSRGITAQASAGQPTSGTGERAGVRQDRPR
jgi:outer membrane protein OmpA-like peptidoglycan-associated protein